MENEWQNYWSNKKSRFFYDTIAEFYRRFIIKPSLNHFIAKHFSKNAKILHAGCGSGQVDKQINTYINITALDISSNALEIYKKENGASSETVLGTVFSTPFKNEHFDGIYNLGVMEHFSTIQIQQILIEFRRVLKKNSKIVLFWPPKYGASVIFFRLLTKFLYFVTRKHYTFHPDEICQLESKQHARSLLEGTNFQLIEYNFGIRDLFTHVILVAQAI